jgi:signal transduction histidine kinase
VVLACVALRNEEPAVALARLLGVAVPVGYGLYRLARVPTDRFARALVGAGAVWSLTTLAESSSSSLYSVGRVSVWLLEPVLVFLLLAFPHGRLDTRGRRRLVTAVVILAATLYVPTALLAPFPTPTPWASCGAHCPGNSFQVTGSTAGFVDDVVRPLRELLTTVLFGVVVVSIARRRRTEGVVLRRILTPVVAVAALRVVTLGGYFVIRAEDASGAAADAFGWLFVLSLAMITVAFAAGVLVDRLFVADALERLTGSLSSRPSARELRDILSDALRDPALEIRFYVPESESRWVGEDGWPVPPPSGGAMRATTQVTVDGKVRAAIIHDRELSYDPALLAGVSSCAITALENRELVGQLRSSLRELGESRARLVSVADDQRRKIERDLHDGAQQRLVALQIKLALLAEQLDARSPENADQLRALENEIEQTLDEVRRLAHGLYPALLADRGLSDALHAVARTAAVPTTIDARLTRRYPREVETAVYFACAEALQNVGKHARATSATVALTENGRLGFEVRDNGVGFDEEASPGRVGLTNMRDRIVALGGEVTVSSRRGRGTSVSGTVPIPPV